MLPILRQRRKYAPFQFECCSPWKGKEWKSAIYYVQDNRNLKDKTAKTGRHKTEAIKLGWHWINLLANITDTPVINLTHRQSHCIRVLEFGWLIKIINQNVTDSIYQGFRIEIDLPYSCVSLSLAPHFQQLHASFVSVNVIKASPLDNL